MRFLEFGNKENKAIILIHGYGISWKMWMPQIDFFRKDYYIIVPVLEGHDTQNHSTFTTVEKAAADIIDYTIRIYGNHIFAICGASLGATIGVCILAQNRLTIDKAIIDGGPIVPMNKILLKHSIKIRIKQMNRVKKGNKPFNPGFFPKELLDELIRILTNMSDETCRNLHLSVYGYSLPASIVNVKTDITYWYGSKEAIFCKKYANALLRVLPHAKIEVFEGLNHGELCIGNPNLYIKKATDFFEI